MADEPGAEQREAFARDRFLAHSSLFGHRHEYPFADFHRQLVEDFWSPEWCYIDLGFRECGKTTLVEEAIAIAASEARFRNCLIVGAKESLAAELLASVKQELENNDFLIAAYGDVRGDVWTQTKITLKHGGCIQAVGRDQSLRGTKHRDWRPDLVIINDFEDDEEILSPDGRRRTLRWVLKVLLPACDRRRRKIRIYDTVRDLESVPMRLIASQKWPHRIIPICYLDENGEERSSWPGHPSLTMEWIAAERATYVSLGEADIWEREYMCNAQSQADRHFTPPMIRVEPQVRAWQAVYAMIDPARTTGRSSAYTGWAVWSWVRNRLVVWEAGAKRLMPDEIIDLAFRLAGDYSPIEVGIEEDGLNEWLLQPIRARMLLAGAIPYRGVRAPRGKIDFIRGLQPFFSAGEAVLCREMPELRDQLLSFPTGRIDAANALAYALLIRPGRLIYEGFNPHVHVTTEDVAWGRAAYLAVNAERGAVTAVLIQCVDGRIVVLADWVAEGDPGAVLEGIVREASMVSRAKVTVIHGHKHLAQYTNLGLVQAARSLGLETRPAGEEARGRELIRRDLGRTLPGGAAFSVNPAARWTLNAMVGGYSTPLVNGQLASEPTPGRYRTLMEGVEQLAGLLAFGLEDEEDRPQNWVYTPNGARYRSALPSRMQARN